ncbi:hypothetical protein, partial [Ruminococcus sp.]|uniref:hypothetical protein n=1 Tax=Ruminococcus sp. TaxID=41978 RepID=UPI00307A3EAB
GKIVHGRLIRCKAAAFLNCNTFYFSNKRGSAVFEFAGIKRRSSTLHGTRGIRQSSGIAALRGQPS